MSQLIFGYGSLMNESSLRATVPDARNIMPCFIKGFIRSFNLWDPIGFNETNLDVKDIPFCAVDICAVENENEIVNGVVFEIEEESFSKLCNREQEYEVIETPVYDWQTAKPLGTASIFSANKNNGTYDFENKAQERYLKICLDGAKAHGNDFYETFLKTTHCEGETLKHFRSKQ